VFGVVLGGVGLKFRTTEVLGRIQHGRQGCRGWGPSLHGPEPGGWRHVKKKTAGGCRIRRGDKELGAGRCLAPPRHEGGDFLQGQRSKSKARAGSRGNKSAKATAEGGQRCLSPPSIGG